MRTHKAFSKRALLLASAMAVVLPAHAWAADVTVNSGQTIGQVVFGGSDQITINAGGKIQAYGQPALSWRSNSTGAAIVNAGTVEGMTSAAILGGYAGPLSITNTGSITSGSTVGGAINVIDATGPITLTNSGVISGGGSAAVYLGLGNNVLNLQTGSNISGSVNARSGNDTANYAGTSATQTNSQLGANLVNFETLNVNSGYWTQRKEVQANTVNIAAGATLHLDETAGNEGYISSTGALAFNIDGKLIAAGNAPANATTYFNSDFTLAGAGSADFNNQRVRLLSDSTLAGPITLNASALAVTGNVAGPVVVDANSSLLIGGAFSSNTPGAENVTLNTGGGATGSVAGNITNNGSVTFDRSTASTYAGVISGTGTVTKSGAPSLTLSGANTYTGLTFVNQGGLTVTGSLASSGIVLAGNTNTVAFNSNSNTNYAGVISGAGGFNKLGTGTLTLSGNSTYTGSSGVQAGKVNLTGSSQSFFVVWQGASLDIGSTGSVANGVYDRPSAGGGVTINNAGSISAPIITADPTRATVQLTGTGALASTLTNSGTIQSLNGFAINMGGGNDTLNLATGSNIVGVTNLGGGIDTINLAGTIGTKTSQQTVQDFIRGGELLNVNSGYWTFNKAVDATNLTVASGATLELDGTGGKDGYIEGLASTPVINGKLVINGDAFPRPAGVYDGAFGLTGSGTVDIQGGARVHFGDSALTGLTTITNGELLVTGAIAGGVNVASGSTLHIGANLGAPDVDGYRTIAAGGGVTGSVGGNIANSGSVIFDRSNDYTYAGVLSGTGTATKLGAGRLTLNGVTQTGLIDVKAGSLVANGAANANLNIGVSGAASTVNGPAVRVGLGGTGTGTVNVNANVTSTNGSGIVTVSNGLGDVTINVAAGKTVSGAVNGISTTGDGSVTIVNRGTISNTALVDPDPNDALDFAAINIANGGSATRNSTVTNSGTISSGNGIAVWFDDGNDTLNLETGSAITGQVIGGSGTDTLNLAGTSATKTATQVFANVASFERVNANSGYWTLKGEASADTVTVASGATLEIEDLSGQNAFFTPNGATLDVAVNGKLVNNTFDTKIYTPDALRLSGAGAVDLKGGGSMAYGANTTFTGLTTVENGLLVVTGAAPGAVTVGSSGTLRIGAAYSAPDLDGVVSIGTGGGATGSVGGNIANSGALIFDRSNAYSHAGIISGAGSVSKLNANTVTLSGAQTYTGATTVSGGSLTVSGSLASSGVAVAGGANLTFTGANNATYAGVVSGAGSLSKAGAGAATLSGANTYTGATTVSAGTLAVTGSIASNTVAVSSGANFTFGNAGALSYGGVVSGAGSLTKTGAGALTLTSANTITGGTTVSGGSLILSSTLAGNATVNAGGTLQIGTGGTTGSLSGNLAANGTVIFNRSDDYLFAGAFSGNGSLIKRGAGKLTLDGVYTFSGTTTIEAGTVKISQLDASGALVVGTGSTVDLSGSNQTVGGLAGGAGSTVNINGSTLTINQPTSTTPTVYGGSLTGTGSLVISGGGITDLAGTNTYTGPTSVNGGTLKVNGSITSNVTVNSGGTLGGSGTITGGVTIGAGGSLAPGNSPGVQTITGPLTLAAGSTTIIEVDPTLTITNDRINVTGTATIASGANLSVRPLGAIANYARVNDYTILTATGGVTGTFGANVTSNMALLTPSLTYSGTSVGLRLIRNDISFASLASTSNQTAVANAAEGTGPSGGAYGALVGQDAAGARAGYDALSGELYGAASSALIDESRHQRSALLRQAGSGEAGAWAQVVGGEATTEATTASAEARNQAWGVAGGGQAARGDWTLGFSLAYGQSDIDVAARASQTDVKTLHAGVYGGREIGGLRLRLGADIAKHSFEAQRSIVFPTVTQTAAADFDGSTRQVFGELSFSKPMGGGVVEPFVEVAGVWSKTDAFTETGAALGLAVAAQERDLLLTTAGVRFSIDTGSSLKPRLSVAWRHAGGDIEGASTAVLGGSSFTVVGASVAEDSALIDAGVAYDVSPTIKASLSYSGVLSSETKDNGVKAGVSMKF